MYADAFELTAVAIQNHRIQLAQCRLSPALNSPCLNPLSSYLPNTYDEAAAA
jgi:hypothetical protein